MSFREKLNSGQFIVTAECGPPQSANGEGLRKKAVHFKKGVDGVNVTDNQTAIVRMSSIASAKILLDEGLEPIVQMTCRDRNRIAMQSDLLGASALNIHNVLFLTGDHQKFGNHPESKGVFDLDSIQALIMAKTMNEGFFLSGESMKTAPELCIGGVSNPFSEPLEMRIIRLKKKIEAGAQFIQTQPVFDFQAFDLWLDHVKSQELHKKTAILAGVMPVKSVKALQYMQQEVPGMKIADKAFHRLERAEDPKEEGVQLAIETIRELRKRKGIQGVHLMPVMWESITPRLLEGSGLI